MQAPVHPFGIVSAARSKPVAYMLSTFNTLGFILYRIGCKGRLRQTFHGAKEGLCSSDNMASFGFLNLVRLEVEIAGTLYGHFSVGLCIIYLKRAATDTVEKYLQF